MEIRCLEFFSQTSHSAVGVSGRCAGTSNRDIIFSGAVILKKQKCVRGFDGTGRETANGGEWGDGKDWKAAVSTGAVVLT